MKYLLLPLLLLTSFVHAQDKMTPELLWSLKRVSAQGLSEDGKTLYYPSRQIDWKTEKGTTKQYELNLANDKYKEWSLADGKNVIQRDKEAIYAMAENNIYRSTE